MNTDVVNICRSRNVIKMNSSDVIRFSIRLAVYQLSINNYSTKTRSSHELLSVHNDINATSASHITMGI